MTSICPRCSGPKAATRQPYCDTCRRAYQHDWHAAHHDQRRSLKRANQDRLRERNRAAVLAYLVAHPCVDCGEDDPVVLEFDHRDGSIKIANVADMLGRNGQAAISAEIAKCDVRCANCHRRRTVQQRVVD